VYLEPVPDDTTLIRWAALLQPATLERFNQRVTALATALKVTHGRKLRTDGTVVESNIHAPSDSSLLVDGVRVLGRTLTRAKAVLGEAAAEIGEAFRNRLRSARRTARQIGEHVSRRSAAAQATAKKAYRRLVQTAQATIAQVAQVLPALQAHVTLAAQALAATLETFGPRVEQVIEQTVRRVFQEEQVPAPEKIVSLFDWTLDKSSGIRVTVAKLGHGHSAPTSAAPTVSRRAPPGSAATCGCLARPAGCLEQQLVRTFAS
jgi:IS5 family transposase